MSASQHSFQQEERKTYEIWAPPDNNMGINHKHNKKKGDNGELLSACLPIPENFQTAGCGVCSYGVLWVSL